MNMYRYLALALFALLAACGGTQDAVGQDLLIKAKAASYGMEGAYVLTVSSATEWIKTPQCGKAGALPEPLCPTLAKARTAEIYRKSARDALSKFDAVIASAPTAAVLQQAEDAARKALSAYQDLIGKKGE